MRGSSWPLTVAAYTPPTGGGVGVACGVGVAAALALAVGEAVPAPGFAGALELGERALRVVGVDVELDAWRLPVARRADPAGDAILLAVHAVAAGVVGVEVPAEDVAIEALQPFAVVAGDLDVDDLCRHGIPPEPGSWERQYRSRLWERRSA